MLDSGSNTSGTIPAAQGGIAAAARIAAARAGRKSRGESRDLGFAWIVAALLGCVAISASSTMSSAWRSVFPVFVMVIYLVLALRRQARNTLRLADSVYFLGFLWTLYALIDTLIRGAGQMTADRVFTVFGYALVTTAVGMFLRLALVQFQRTVDDQVDQAQDEVDNRVKTFVESLTKASDVVNGMAGQLAGQGAKLEAEILNLETRIKRLEIPKDLLVTEIKNALAPIKTEADHFAVKTKELTTGVSAVSGQLGSVKTELAGVHASFKRLPEATKPVEQGMRSLEDALVEVLTFMRKATLGDRK